MTRRTAQISRKTGETDISVTVDLDGTGQYSICTGNGMFDHLLAQISRHGLIDVELSASGDVEVGWHHIVEDVGIVLGRALRQAVGDGSGIIRTGHSFVPLDETLALVAIDLSGRGYPVIDAKLSDTDLGSLSASLVTHFLETLSREGRFNLHAQVLAGANNHHKAEALFKALARALRAASAIDERRGGGVPSTKGTIEG